MPQGEKYWNPYRMIPVKNGSLERHRPITHEAIKGISGEIEASLTTITPLLIGTQEGKYKKPVLNRKKHLPVLPGSSLKGMIRSLAELVGNGCDVTDSSDPEHSKCKNIDRLCICCRLFGMQHDQQSFMGKVHFSEGCWTGEGKPEIVENQPVLLSNPKDRHSAFYNSNKKYRKFYHHQPLRTTGPRLAKDSAQEKMISLLTVIKSNEIFSIKVSFNNLEEDEFGLLLYCLSLEHNVTVIINGLEHTGDLCHKLGMGKPIGLGSTKIDLLTLIFFESDYAKRYQSWGSPSKKFIKDEDLRVEVFNRTASIRNDNSPTMNYLRSMLLWIPEDQRSFRYPERNSEKNWFTDHNKVPLKDPISGR